MGGPQRAGALLGRRGRALESAGDRAREMPSD